MSFDVSTINATSGNSAAGSAPTLAANATTAKESSDRFLKLLVAQLQNQDPLSPMDNAQVTSQIAQINTVSGIEKLNTTVQGLSSQFVQMQALQGAALVGHDVVVAGNKLDIANGSGEGGFELQSAADSVKVEVLSGAGRVIDTLDLGAQSAGMNTFRWPSGNYDNASGLTFRVSANAGATALAATPLMQDKVTAVSTKGDTLMLELARTGTVAYGTVKALN